MYRDIGIILIFLSVYAYQVFTNNKFCSDKSLTHIPISCVPREDIGTSRVTAVTSSSTQAYITDIGRGLVYRVDMAAGGCGSFGSEVLGTSIVL